MQSADHAEPAGRPSVAPEAEQRRVRATILRLAAAQALAGANSTVIFATGSIIGAMLAPSAGYATLPISVFVVGMAAATLPTGWISRRHGRRTAFMIGTGFGVLAGLIGAAAVVLGSFALFCLATLCGGLYAAVVLSFRFAAADGAQGALRAKAVAWVMAGGVFAGVIGPQLVTFTMSLWQPYLFAASYLAQALVALLTMGVLVGVDLPRPPAGERGKGRPLRVIAGQPRFIVAVVCGVVSYTLMNLVMTSAPLAMHLCGLAVPDSNLAIQWHVIAMYAPSFFTGTLIARFGARRVIVAGLACTLLAATSGISGTSVLHFSATLILLGLGWNFGFVGASALVLETHRPEERNKVQSFNDFLVFGTMAVGSFASGKVLAAYGWAAVNWVVFPPVLLALALLAATRVLYRRPVAAG